MAGVSGGLGYRQSLDGCLASGIGSSGLEAAEFRKHLDELAPAITELKAQHASGALPLLRIGGEKADIDPAEQALARLSQGAGTIVFFGTGGSSLGGQTLAQLAGWNLPGGADEKQKGRPRTRFYDNLDAGTLAGALASLDLARTRFVVISKSGGTVETLVQAVAALTAVKAAELEARIPELFLALTEPARPGIANGLLALADAHGIPTLEHPTGIGGRFSVLTTVGLLPAMARGLDVRAIRAGADAVVRQMLAATTAEGFAPAEGAAAAVALARTRGIRVQVMMPYADRLGRLAHWYVQLWAESLGKAGQGTTPLAALGPLDQHSQLQLFMDGAREHMLTFLRVRNAPTGPALAPDLVRMSGLDYMTGRTIGDLVTAQSEAVPEALMKAGRPVRTIDLDRLDERTMGAMLMHFMLETILAARLMAIDPFDQPAVELAKRLAKERLKKA